MQTYSDKLNHILDEAQIYGPDSSECDLQEKSLVRFLEKEYQSYLNKPVCVPTQRMP